MKMLPTLVAILPAVVLASTAMAHGYSGNYPLTVTHSQFINGDYCLTLTDDGSEGRAHSGPASIAGQPYGIFQLIGGTIVAVIQEQAGDQNNGLTFTAAASGGNIANRGVTVLIEDGSLSDSGYLSIGQKGGC